MSGKTQFWLGSVALALAIGLMVGGVGPRRGYAQEGGLGEGRSRRYAMVTGIRGSSTNTQTVYVVDDVNQLLYALEYHSRSNEFKMRNIGDIRKYSDHWSEVRDKADRKKRPD